MSSSAMSPGSMTASRRVGAVRATLLSYRVLIRQVVSAGRLAALGALGAIMIVVGWVAGVAAADRDLGSTDMLRDGAGYADAFGLIVIVPIISLVFAAASLGDAATTARSCTCGCGRWAARRWPLPPPPCP